MLFLCIWYLFLCYALFPSVNSKKCKTTQIDTKSNALGEDRTNDLPIMRLTRCLLRYRGSQTHTCNEKYISNKLPPVAGID